jgi:hypothetical protein
MITRFDFDPTILDRLVQPTLKISIPHTHEVIASKYAEWANFILNENLEDLACDAFVRRQVKHPILAKDETSHRMKSPALTSEGRERRAFIFGTST